MGGRGWHYLAMDDASRRRKATERIYRDLVERGADFSAWPDSVEVDRAGGWGWLPLSAIGDYTAALRLLGHRIFFESFPEMTPEERVVDRVEYLLQLAGIEATVESRTSTAMIDGCDWERASGAPIVLEISAAGRSVWFRPGVWRGELEIDTVIGALNRLVGEVVLGCGLDAGRWQFFPSNDPIDHYLEGLLAQAAELLSDRAHWTVASYRPHGFFGDLAYLDERSASLQLARQTFERFGISGPDVTEPRLELLMLATDQKRVWYMADAEHNAPPATALLDMLESWAGVSVGAMVVNDATIESEIDGPEYTLAAVVNGSPISVTETRSDWAPTAALQNAVNAVIVPQHEVIAGTTGVQDVFAIVASPALRDLLHSRAINLRSSFDWEHKIG